MKHYNYITTLLLSSFFLMGLTTSCNKTASQPKSPQKKEKKEDKGKKTNTPEEKETEITLPGAEIIKDLRTYFEVKYTDQSFDQLNQLVLTPKSIGKYREQMKELWKEAALKTITGSGFETIKSDTAPTYIWRIPDNELMQVKVFSKGSKSVLGYPLYINLHGGGQNTDVRSAWSWGVNSSEWEAAKKLSLLYRDQNSLYFVPRMSDDRKGRWQLRPQRVAFRKAIRLGVASGNVNPQRIYLLGISEGGYGTHRLALFMPDRFTAVGAMAGVEPIGESEQNLRNLPTRIEVGENDSDYDRNINGRAWKEHLERLARENSNEFENVVNIQKGKGHGINYYEVSPWLEQHKQRVTYPKHLSYVLFDMDGYARGVYYLGFRGLKNTKGASILFDVQHVGNKFTVKTKQLQGTTEGELEIYIDHVDFSKPIEITLNGKSVYNQKVIPNIGAMTKSLIIFDDPLRIFPALVRIPLK